MKGLAGDLGFDGSPFQWNEERRARLRAELDAWYARAYGLTRDELRYILDPADVMGEDYPSETFREGGGARDLRGPWRRLAAAHAGRSAADLVEERVRVFGHAVRGPCPPYELEYGPEHFLGKSHRMGDAAAFLRAFGVEVAGTARERPDHVAVEAEFLSLLCLKRALAEGRGEGERASVCRDAERLFLEEHLGRFLPALSRRVAEREPGGALDAALSLGVALAERHGASVGARIGPPDLDLRPLGTVEEETVVSCSSCSVPGAGSGGGEGAEV